MSSVNIVLIPIDGIHRTEKISEEHARSLAHEMQISGVWTHPLLVENDVGSLMDGHHRYRAAQILGLDWVPVIELEYSDPVVQLESWRPGENFTVDQIHAVAESGDLLPYKSTRHVIEAPIPRCCVPLSQLRGGAIDCRTVLPAMPHLSRTQRLASHYHAIGKRMGVRTLAAEAIDVETAQTQAPHPRLRQMLQNDPAMAALLPASTGRLGLGDQRHSPFLLKRSDLLLLPPTFLESPGALAVAARWGLEVIHTRSVSELDARRLTSLLRYGAALVSALHDSERTLFLDSLPALVAAELQIIGGRSPTIELLQWQATLIEGLSAPKEKAENVDQIELELPVEQLLVAGGDSRLIADPLTGFNRYGVPPRPRPEAVHFSSSTASAISDYGFLYCDLMRRDLLNAELQKRVTPRQLRKQATQGVADELKLLLSVDLDAADVVIAASGTDTELVSVMLTLANTEKRKITNILISPAESGRGVQYAASGCYFDELTSDGHSATKGKAIWDNAQIDTCCIAIRDSDGYARPIEEIDAEFLAAGRQALAEGNTVLAHMLATSKTGLSAPSIRAVDALVALAPERVDVVVDACQMRWDLDRIGTLIMRGWSVQISGSKFLTGPPFSGALVIPSSYRSRVGAVGELLSVNPGTASAADWSQWWADRLAVESDSHLPSYGPLFRWLPAILEARLLGMLPTALREYAFEKFRTAIVNRITVSNHMQLIDVSGDVSEDDSDDVEVCRSIVCFSVLALDESNEPYPLNESECRKIFECLNVDVSNKLGELLPGQRMIAQKESHIGQPVALVPGQISTAILRMVLGARFFNIVGHAGPGAIEAALESEISDAFRALDKLELLAQNWRLINDKNPKLQTAA